ncbi:MAG: hypothetical protein K8S98_15705 [Planctomycetes bacterium]|nr:hypothetical protein [Planctomycetota bacterium]
MEQLTDIGDREAWSTRLARPFLLESPFSGGSFALLLRVLDTTITREEQTRLSERIVRLGCRYAVCAGHGCSSWDDSIDMAHLATDANFDPPDSEFVMTTWHDDESIEDVAEFFVRATRFEGFEPRRFLVVCLGGDEADYVQVRDAVRTCLRT